MSKTGPRLWKAYIPHGDAKDGMNPSGLPWPKVWVILGKIQGYRDPDHFSIAGGTTRLYRLGRQVGEEGDKSQ